MRGTWLAAALIGLIGAQAALADSLGDTELEDIVTPMAQIGRSFSPSFSPDGTKLAFVSTQSGSPQVWIVPVAGGAPTQLTTFDDPVGAVLWSPTQDWLAFTLLPGGGLNTQIYVIHPDGSGLKRITDGGKENNFLDRWTRDGKALALSSNRRDGAHTDPYLYDVESGELKRLEEATGINDISDVTADRRFAIVTHLANRGDNDLYLVDAEKGTHTALTPHMPPALHNWGEFAADGRTIYLITNENHENLSIAKLTLGDDGRPSPIDVIAERDGAQADLALFTPDRTRAAIVWNIGGRGKLEFLDVTAHWMTQGPMLPAEIVNGLAWSTDGKTLALVMSGSVTPVDIYLLENKAIKFRQLTFSPHQGVELSTLIRPEPVTFPAQDELELRGWLYKPANFAAPGPVVISFHGGPESQERPSFNATYQALLARGIAVFAPNVRGSAGFGRTFVNLDNGPLRVNAIRDIEASANYVISSGIGDPKRLGIMGGSYGGYMVMAAVTEYPDLFAAGADLFGIVNFETFFAHSEPWMAAISTSEYGDPATHAELLRRLSPIHKLDLVKTPLLVMHGANDTNVPVIEAEQIVDNLKGRGVDVDYVLFPDEGHGWRKTQNRVTSDLTLVRFFEKHLKK